MKPTLRWIYLAVFLGLIVIGLVVQMPVWGAVLLGLAAMVPVAVADVIVAKRRNGSR